MSVAQVLKLEDYVKDPATLGNLVNVFKEVGRSGQVYVCSGSEVLFTALSPEMTKEILYNRMTSILSENPNLIKEIQDRLGEELVD